jgi:hypothetical protein
MKVRVYSPQNLLLLQESDDYDAWASRNFSAGRFQTFTWLEKLEQANGNDCNTFVFETGLRNGNTGIILTLLPDKPTTKTRKAVLFNQVSLAVAKTKMFNSIHVAALCGQHEMFQDYIAQDWVAELLEEGLIITRCEEKNSWKISWDLAQEAAYDHQTKAILPHVPASNIPKDLERDATAIIHELQSKRQKTEPSIL